MADPGGAAGTEAAGRPARPPATPRWGRPPGPLYGPPHAKSPVHAKGPVAAKARSRQRNFAAWCFGTAVAQTTFRGGQVVQRSPGHAKRVLQQ